MSLEEFEDSRNSYMGYCLNCGNSCFDVEPDASRYPCEICESHQVYGIEELLIMGRLEIGESRDS